MRGLGPALLLAIGCVPDVPGTGIGLLSDQPVTVELFLEGEPKAGGGSLVVQASFDPDGQLAPPQPVAEGLSFEPDGPPASERVGGHQVVRQRYVYRGSKGSYEIPPLIATWSGPDGEEVQAETRAVWVDLGVEPPEVGELADIVEPSPVWTVPWGPILAVTGAGLLFVGGLVFAFARPRSADQGPVRREPPDVRVLHAWEAVRKDAALDDEAKAEALSRLFREYTEEVLAFHATAWTTTEIVRKLQSMAQLPEGNVPRAKRLLRATDRIKFADAKAGADLFEELDSDLRAFVGSTRPAAWRETQP
jgi:hypothetical protein